MRVPAEAPPFPVSSRWSTTVPVRRCARAYRRVRSRGGHGGEAVTYLGAAIVIVVVAQPPSERSSSSGGAPRGRVLQRWRPRRRRLRGARDGLRDHPGLRRVPRVRELRHLARRRGAGGGARGAAVRDGAVHAARGAPAVGGRARLLRALGRPQGVAGDAQRQPQLDDQPVVGRPLQGAPGRPPEDPDRTGGVQNGSTSAPIASRAARTASTVRRASSRCRSGWGCS